MGLDITAYQNLRRVENPELDADGYPIRGRRLYVNQDFSARAEGIQDRAVYEYEDSFGFRAGSYGGYNEWRNELAKLAGYQAEPYRDRDGKLVQKYDRAAWRATEGPFYELIHFSDCEGIIGPIASKKLADDFARFEDQAKNLDEWFIECYQNWKRAFEMASNNGAVDFH